MKYINQGKLQQWVPPKLLLIMRLIIVILTACIVQVSAKSFAQKLTYSKRGASLQEIFTQIRKQTNFLVVYSDQKIDDTKKIDVKFNQTELTEVLDLISAQQGLTYVIDDKTISFKPKEPSFLESLVNRWAFIDIKGKVVDSLGRPLAGALVKVKGSKLSTSADRNGEFILKGVESDKIVVISFLGYVSRELKPVTNMGSIVLKIEPFKLEEVTINTGLFEKRKETFTGVTRTFSGRELREASRINVLEGLNLLDPSFKIIRDNNLGSDPNQLPKVELRGSRNVPPPTPNKYSQQLKLEYEQDPNQPLFILDGFETTLAAIVNLDVNRVASITLLKDAASTALYGSRSANGVVVVETIRPAAGDLQISYTATASLAIPDLSGYNLMDGSELLKFQELSSVGLDAPGPFYFHPNGGRGDLYLPTLKHSFRENAIRSGVNTDWKKVPLQYASTLNHSFSVNGGDKFLSYNLGLSKGTNLGVMKGSENSSTTGYGTLNYRNGKVNISNNLNIGGNNQSGSPYGSFQSFVKVPPFYTASLTDRYLEEHHAEYFDAYGSRVSKDFYFANPLYNAQLPYKNSVVGFTLTNNLMANWDILPFLRISSGFQYGKSNSEADYFTSPLNTAFDFVEASQKGSYDYSSSRSQRYNGYLTLTYNKVFANKHIVTANVRGDMGETLNEGQSVSAVGFAATSEPLIYLANSYRPDNKPGGSTVKSSSVALIGSLNYSYDMRYNLDFSYNLSGTSNFGSDNPYQSFYAVGLGWNIGRESFLKNSKIVNALNISANIGLTGNQNAGNFGSRSTYMLNNTPSYFGEAVQLNGLGNPNLDWSKTYNISYNLSGVFFKNVLSLTMSGYQNITDPLIVEMPLPPSVGIKTGNPVNIGKLTSTGLELTLDARLVSAPDWTVSVGLNAPLIYKSEYSGLGKTLDKFNDAARGGGFTQRYYDGSSPDDVWAIRSLGIGQARGLEVYLDKYDNITYVYDKNNEVMVGSSRPVTQGNINVRMRYKRFTLSVFGNYIVQEMKFNTALFNKVENLSPADLEFNQDKRALYTRWQKIGDDASFLGITNSTMGMSSRFLQKENAFEVSSVNFNYDLLNHYSQGLKSYLKKKLGLEGLNFGVTTSKIFEFRLSNVRMERGLDYPFQRSVMFNVNVTF